MKFRFLDSYIIPSVMNSSSKRTLSTEIQLDPEEFDIFRVQEDTDLTFNLKEFKVASHLALLLVLIPY